MKLALAQMAVDPGKVRVNRDEAVTRVERASTRGADLVVLPELFTVGYFAFDSYAREAEPLDGETLTALGAAAADHGVAVLAGSIVEDLSASAAAGFETPADEGYANTSVFLDRDGTRRSVYRKHHLFGYDSAEQELLTPGESLATVPFEGFTVATTTCYDLRFPELYRRLVEAGATLVCVPSAWPYPRVEHWELLPRARAVENLLYVAAANGVGEFETASLLGRSAVYDPWGTQVAGLGDQPGLVTARLDPGAVTRRREEFPALADRREQ
ncbi:MAG: putative amidohydrolase [Halovenus sp.]